MQECDKRPIHSGYPELTPLEKAVKHLNEIANTLSVVNRYYMTGQTCTEVEKDLRLVLERVK